MSKPVTPNAEARVLYLGDVNERSAENIIRGLFEFDMQSPEKPIRLIVNSYGGGVDSMFSIYDAMKTCRAPIMTVGLGKIMSAGVLILAAGTKGERRIAPNARVMIHEIWSLTYGKLYEMEADIKAAAELQERMEKLLVQESDLTKTKLKEIMKSHTDTYITAQQTKKFGIVDKIGG